MHPNAHPAQTPPQHRPPRRRRQRMGGAAAIAIVGALLLSACGTSNQTKVLRMTNSARRATGRHGYVANQAAMVKAQRWARHMASTGVVEHTGGGTSMDTSGLPGWCGVGENVGRGPTTSNIHSAWMRSPGHRANILGNYDHAGTGVVRKGRTVYAVEIFYRAC